MDALTAMKVRKAFEDSSCFAARPLCYSSFNRGYMAGHADISDDSKDLKIADLRAEVITLRAQLEGKINPLGVLHIRHGGCVSRPIEDPLDYGDYYIIKMNSRD